MPRLCIHTSPRQPSGRRCAHRSGEDEREPRTAGREGTRLDRSPVGLRDPPRDRQAQARAPGAVARGPGQARERLEDPLPVLGAIPGPWSSTLTTTRPLAVPTARAPPRRAGSGRWRCPPGSAAAGRAERGRPASVPGPARRLPGARPARRRAPSRRAPCRARSRRRPRAPVEHQGRVVPGRELQQVADEPAEPVGLGDDVLEQVAPVARDQLLALEDLGVGPDERRRRPQLVRRVGDEPPLGLEALADRDERSRRSRSSVMTAAASRPTAPTTRIASTRLRDCCSWSVRSNPPWT